MYTRDVNRIGIRDLRQDLSGQIKRAAAGETIVVTVDGEPKARLVPLESASDPRTMEELIAAGRVIPARRRGQKAPVPPPRFKGKRPSQEILDEIRADRF